MHKNKTLPKIEKVNYLKGKLSGEALKAISGLPLSNDNYDVAIDILKTRFGRDQELVDLNYTQLISLQPATNKTSSLRSFLNDIEKTSLLFTCSETKCRTRCVCGYDKSKASGRCSLLAGNGKLH